MPHTTISGSMVFKIIAFLLFFLIAVVSVNAQTPENVKAKVNKTQLSIKPNSRDMNVVIRNNSLQRIDRQRKQMMIKNQHQMKQKKVVKKNTNQIRRQEMMQRRKQMIEQRNRVRR